MDTMLLNLPIIQSEPLAPAAPARPRKPDWLRVKLPIGPDYAAVRKLVGARMRELPSADFQEMLRSAMREDEWLLLLHGAVLGFAAGLLHLAIFGPG